MENILESSFVRALIEGTVLLPAGVTVLYGLATHRIRRSETSWRSMLWVPGLLVGFFSGFAAAYHSFTFPPRTVLSWVPWLTVGGVVCVAVAARGAGMWRVQLVRAVVCAVSAFLLQRPILAQESIRTALAEWSATAALWFVLWSGLVPSRTDQKAAAIALLACVAGLALAAPLSGSIVIARLGGSLAVTLGVALVFALFIRPSPWGLPTADLAALVFGMLMLDLGFYAQAPVSVMACLAAAPAAAGAGRVLAHRGWIGERWRILVPALAAIAPVIMAVWFAVRLSRSAGGY